MPMRKSIASVAAISAALPGARAQLQLSAERVHSGPALFACSPPGESNRLFLVAQSGQITVIKNGAALPTLFLNLQGSVSGGGEAGLLGMAFHPQFAQNGFSYVYYSTLGGV